MQGKARVLFQVFGLHFEARALSEYFLMETLCPAKGIWYKVSLVWRSAVSGEFLSGKRSAAIFVVLPGLWVLTCCSFLGVPTSG